ncbi:hypothetical protein, partial [uncultured Rhodococcus sp.]
RNSHSYAEDQPVYFNPSSATSIPTTPSEHAVTAKKKRTPAKATHTAPSPEVVAATEFLLGQPDARALRRRYLELITRTTSASGKRTTDYAAAERYLLTTAAKLRRTRPNPPPPTTKQHHRSDQRITLRPNGIRDRSTHAGVKDRRRKRTIITYRVYTPTRRGTAERSTRTQLAPNQLNDRLRPPGPKLGHPTKI